MTTLLDPISIAFAQDASRPLSILCGAGYRDAVTTEADIWAGTALVRNLSSGIPVVVSTSANDTAAGTGARTVRVTGIDGNGSEQSEDASLLGLSTVSLAKVFERISRVEVLTAGSLRSNAGIISARLAGNEVSAVPVARGRSTEAAIFVPAGRRAVILTVRVSSSLAARAMLVRRPLLSATAADVVLAEGFGSATELVSRALVIDGPVEVFIRASAASATSIGATIEAIQNVR